MLEAIGFHSCAAGNAGAMDRELPKAQWEQLRKKYGLEE